jgi:hypothetical protein
LFQHFITPGLSLCSPCFCPLINFLDERLLARHVAGNIVGKPLGQVLFYFTVLLSFFRMRSQVVSEIEVPLDFRVAKWKGVNMMSAVDFVSLDEEPSSTDAKFAFRQVAQCNDSEVERIELFNIADDHQNINDGFGPEVWHRGTSNVMNAHHLLVENSEQVESFFLEELRPFRIVGHHFNCPEYRNQIGHIAPALLLLKIENGSEERLAPRFDLGPQLHFQLVVL